MKSSSRWIAPRRSEFPAGQTVFLPCCRSEVRIVSGTTAPRRSGPFSKLLAQAGLARHRVAGEKAGVAGWPSVCPGPEESNVIALHDCDILSHNREYLARLCYPIVNATRLRILQGYYSRVTNRLHGRVTRLYFTPLILKPLQQMRPGLTLCSPSLDSFRYPLAGNLPWCATWPDQPCCPAIGGWKSACCLKFYRNCALRRIARRISPTPTNTNTRDRPDNAERGLQKMCVDITKSLFRNLASEVWCCRRACSRPCATLSSVGPGSHHAIPKRRGHQ